MGVKACRELPTVAGRWTGLEDGFMELARFDDFRAIGGNQITDIAAERIDARFGLRGIDVDEELVLRGGQNGHVVGTIFAVERMLSEFDGAGGEKIEAVVG